MKKYFLLFLIFFNLLTNNDLNLVILTTNLIILSIDNTPFVIKFGTDLNLKPVQAEEYIDNINPTLVKELRRITEQRAKMLADLEQEDEILNKIEANLEKYKKEKKAQNNLISSVEYADEQSQEVKDIIAAVREKKRLQELEKEDERLNHQYKLQNWKPRTNTNSKPMPKVKYKFKNLEQAFAEQELKEQE